MWVSAGFRTSRSRCSRCRDGVACRPAGTHGPVAAARARAGTGSMTLRAGTQRGRSHRCDHVGSSDTGAARIGECRGGRGVRRQGGRRRRRRRWGRAEADLSEDRFTRQEAGVRDHGCAAVVLDDQRHVGAACRSRCSPGERMTRVCAGSATRWSWSSSRRLTAKEWSSTGRFGSCSPTSRCHRIRRQGQPHRRRPQQSL